MTRILVCFSIVHTKADLGGLGEAVARSTMMKVGQRGLYHKTKAIEQVWIRIERAVRGLNLDFSKTRLYQDGLPVCGREAEIVAQMAQAGSRNHQLLQALMAKGAILMGTESWELLKQEYQMAKASLASAAPAGRPKVSEAQARGDALLEQRDRFIAQRINETLQPGETGLLFLGMLHSVDKHLSPDIRAIHPLR